MRCVHREHCMQLVVQDESRPREARPKILSLLLSLSLQFYMYICIYMTLYVYIVYTHNAAIDGKPEWAVNLLRRVFRFA